VCELIFLQHPTQQCNQNQRNQTCCPLHNRANRIGRRGRESKLVPHGQQKGFMGLLAFAGMAGFMVFNPLLNLCQPFIDRLVPSLIHWFVLSTGIREQGSGISL
jgi:hypothetical protein